MKITELQRYLQATLDRFGDVDCLMDIDPESEDLYEVDSIFCDVNPDDENDVNLVFACFEVRPMLKLV